MEEVLTVKFDYGNQRHSQDAWLENFLQRSGALRAQLAAMVSRSAGRCWAVGVVYERIWPGCVIRA